jgi:hypothetical protein
MSLLHPIYCTPPATPMNNAAASLGSLDGVDGADKGAPAALRSPAAFSGCQGNPSPSGVNSYLSSGVTIRRVSRSQIWSCSRHTVHSQPRSTPLQPRISCRPRLPACPPAKRRDPPFTAHLHCPPVPRLYPQRIQGSNLMRRTEQRRADEHQHVRPQAGRLAVQRDVTERFAYQSQTIFTGLKPHARRATEQARSDAVERKTIAFVPQRR